MFLSVFTFILSFQKLLEVGTEEDKPKQESRKPKGSVNKKQERKTEGQRHWVMRLKDEFKREVFCFSILHHSEIQPLNKLQKEITSKIILN